MSERARRSLLLAAMAAAMFLNGPARAMDREALEAQTATALASIDYAKARCPQLVIDETALTRLLQRTGKTAAALRAHEDYDDQRNVLRSVDSQKGAAMVCFVLPQAHSGVARGLIRSR